ncbi:MAG: ATP-grasp domain-containing protein [Coriobacteriales bacterium]|nr:ATP-grasp domain-containing protein [Coriobacteriales bacterium]
MRKTKLAVVGASHFQLPLIETAQRMGCEVHAFAWECGDVGETVADVFHPISIVEVDNIVATCKEVGVDGICTIASDLATVAVNHVAHELGLIGNSLECTQLSTNKHHMRDAFQRGNDPSPKSLTVGLDQDGSRVAVMAAGEVVDAAVDLSDFDPTAFGLAYPLIVKPTDRSGSRGVTKIEAPNTPVSVSSALSEAFSQSFSKQAMVEEYVEGDEFSVEGISWEGQHHILTITRKATSGAPHFIETAHLQPACLPAQTVALIEQVTTHALDTLQVRYGASHTELKITPNGDVRIIEIGARMGGDCIGSDLVLLSTGIDFVSAVVDVALGNEPNLTPKSEPAAAASCFMFNQQDVRAFERIQEEHPELVRLWLMTAEEDEQVVSDSSTRLGHYVLSAPRAADLAPFLPPKLARAALAEAATDDRAAQA